MKDLEPSLYAFECPEPQEGKWPENQNPTEIDQRRIYPRKGKVFENNRKSAEKVLDMQIIAI